MQLKLLHLVATNRGLFHALHIIHAIIRKEITVGAICPRRAMAIRVCREINAVNQDFIFAGGKNEKRKNDVYERASPLQIIWPRNRCLGRVA